MHEGRTTAAGYDHTGPGLPDSHRARGDVRHPERTCPLILGPAAEMDGLWEVAAAEELAASTSPPPEAERLTVVAGSEGRRSDRAEATAGRALMAPMGVIEGEPADGMPVGDEDNLTVADADNLKSVLTHVVARNTVRNYRIQWRRFIAWALSKGLPALPASPTQVAAYLAKRIEEDGHRPATVRVAAAAIGFVHKTAGLDDPCASLEVKRTLRGAIRKGGRGQKQAEGLTAELLDIIQEAAYNPRRGRGGRLESLQTAASRGDVDIALISLMRDALLRVSEAAVLIWKDIETKADGSGRLLIRRSKTDPEGEGAVVFVSAPTMAVLRRIRNCALDADSVFGLRPNQLSKRIKRAAQAAGLGSGFSGHSPRVGMARDLARAGIELPSLMNAGRWRTPVMPAHYIRNESAGRGAVAQFYGHYRRIA